MFEHHQMGKEWGEKGRVRKMRGGKKGMMGNREQGET